MILRKQFLKKCRIGIEWEFRSNAYWVLKKVLRQFSWEKVFSSNGAETTWYPHAKE